MAQRKRTPFERAEILRRIADLYLRGVQQADIAKDLGVTQQQISYDLKKIQEGWAAQTAMDLDVAKQQELARIDAVEREYWIAWERSKGEKTKARQESNGKDAAGKPKVTKTFAEKEQMLGNPQFLAGVMACVAERSKLLGLYAPLKQELNGKLNGSFGVDIGQWKAKQDKVQGQVTETLRDFDE